MISLQNIFILLVSFNSRGLPSWINLPHRHVALERDLPISYEIDRFDPARFNDIHALLHAGSSLLYASRVAVGKGTLVIPCGVITFAGNHSLSIAYTNGTVITSGNFEVVWPVVTINTPTRVETFTTDVSFNVGFTRAVCPPKLGSDEGVLQGGENGLPAVWVKLELCKNPDCTESEVRFVHQLESFYTSPVNQITIPCRFWGWPGTYRAAVGVEPSTVSEEAANRNAMIATSRVVQVVWSSDYKILSRESELTSCEGEDSVVVELDYPHCIGTQDKLRLYTNPIKPGAGRPRYLGEERVVPGDKAVVFPCSLFNSSREFSFCFHYVSTSESGRVSRVTDTCSNDLTGSWGSWSSWTECSSTCGQGSRSRFRFCSQEFECRGERVAWEKCQSKSCPTPTTDSTQQISTSTRRPTPSSPCSCGCTYILHTEDSDTSREIHVTSGLCKSAQVSWTLRVPDQRILHLNLSHVRLSCPGLQLSLRDGVLSTDPILVQSGTVNSPVSAVTSSLNVVKLELRSGQQDLLRCFAEFTLNLRITDQETKTVTLYGEAWRVVKQVFGLITPVVVVVLLVLLVLLCTVIMLADYVVKRAKYTRWKERPADSATSSPDLGRSCVPGAQYASLSTISEYIPLSAEGRELEAPAEKDLVTPVQRRRRRLLRRRETLSDWRIDKKVEPRKSSLPGKIHLSRSMSARDSVDAPSRLVTPLSKRRNQRPSEMRLKLPRHRDSTSTLSSDTARKRPLGRESDLSSSEMTLRPARSVSGLSCTSNEQELEFDLYDCDLGNAMAAPGSMFAPAYWDAEKTPTLELELTELFPEEDDSEAVELREGERRGMLTTSITSDLTSSISSAVSGTTLVGEVGEEEEEPGENSNLLGDSKDLDTSCYYSGEETEPCLPNQADERRKYLMNMTNIDRIYFAED